MPLPPFEAWVSDRSEGIRAEADGSIHATAEAGESVRLVAPFTAGDRPFRLTFDLHLHPLGYGEAVRVGFLDVADRRIGGDGILVTVYSSSAGAREVFFGHPCTQSLAPPAAPYATIEADCLYTCRLLWNPGERRLGVAVPITCCRINIYWRQARLVAGLAFEPYQLAVMLDGQGYAFRTEATITNLVLERPR